MFAPRGDRDGCAGANEGLRNRESDSPRATRNDRDFTFWIIFTYGWPDPWPPACRICFDRVARSGYPYYNFARKRSLTIFGLAFPFEALITWPTKKPINVSLPER